MDGLCAGVLPHLSDNSSFVLLHPGLCSISCDLWQSGKEWSAGEFGLHKAAMTDIYYVC